MKYLKVFEKYKVMNTKSGVPYIQSSPGYAKSSIINDIAKKLGYNVVDHRISKSIWEVDDENSNSLTGFSIDLDQNEINILENNKLIINVADDGVDDYFFKKKDREKILKILELIRTTKKYNL